MRSAFMSGRCVGRRKDGLGGLRGTIAAERESDWRVRFIVRRAVAAGNHEPVADIT
jgi:hypothetical protein